MVAFVMRLSFTSLFQACSSIALGSQEDFMERGLQFISPHIVGGWERVSVVSRLHRERGL